MRASVITFGFVLTTLAACSGEPANAPQAAAVEARRDLSAQAFRLLIDTRSGHIDVVPPSAAKGSTSSVGASFSLLGQEAVDVSAEPCTFAAIPDKPRYKRCTFDIRLQNTLSATDLVTPTTFPRPPEGTSGSLAFPFSALTETGEEATPSPDWDLGPANFFNDVANCSAGAKSDCYRYELFPSPTYAGAVLGVRQVGFDIPLSAQTVTAYVVVAADLRDNPPRTITLNPIPALCGYVYYGGDAPLVYTDSREIDVSNTVASIGYCSFGNTLPAGARIRSAKLRMLALRGEWEWVEAQPVNYGTSIDATDVLLPSLFAGSRFDSTDPRFIVGDNIFWADANVVLGVRAVESAGSGPFQFRLMLNTSAPAFTLAIAAGSGHLGYTSRSSSSNTRCRSAASSRMVVAGSR